MQEIIRLGIYFFYLMQKDEELLVSLSQNDFFYLKDQCSIGFYMKFGVMSYIYRSSVSVCFGRANEV